jgi:hypothetical protein
MSINNYIKLVLYNLGAGFCVVCIGNKFLKMQAMTGAPCATIRAAELIKTAASRLDRAEESPGSTEQSAR